MYLLSERMLLLCDVDLVVGGYHAMLLSDLWPHSVFCHHTFALYYDAEQLTHLAEYQGF